MPGATTSRNARGRLPGKTTNKVVLADGGRYDRRQSSFSVPGMGDDRQMTAIEVERKLVDDFDLIAQGLQRDRDWLVRRMVECYMAYEGTDILGEVQASAGMDDDQLESVFNGMAVAIASPSKVGDVDSSPLDRVPPETMRRGRNLLPAILARASLRNRRERIALFERPKNSCTNKTGTDGVAAPDHRDADGETSRAKPT
jgi:hypothetical protein